MIVKFLYTSGPNGHFPAVAYNSGKMDRNKGELMKVANFGSLQALGHLRPEDYKNYLKMVSATNKAVKKPQLHVAISGAGKSYDKNQLTEIAIQWMERMGYGKQPYLIIFHKDTGNNHVHVVGTRVDKQGKKIDDSYEQIRGQQQMNIVMGLDEKHSFDTDLKKALTYHFGTKAQFMMVMESMGYTLKEQDGQMIVMKFGKRRGEIDLESIDEKLRQYQPDEKRLTQLKAFFHKYAALYDTSLTTKNGRYISEFSACLKEKFGIELFFHASEDKLPYGYTVIDHAEHHVCKGGEIMALKDLLALQQNKQTAKEDRLIAGPDPGTGFYDGEQADYYAAILKASLYNYPDLSQGLQHQGLFIFRQGEEWYLSDPGTGAYFNAADLLDEQDYRQLLDQISGAAGFDEAPYRHQAFIPEPYIAPDVDDEAVHGRKRKRKARTNQR